MSNDLINRKALMVAINTDFYEHFTAYHDSDQTALIDMVMQDIEEIPTAYDVDAVCNLIADYKELVPGWVLKEIIDIVKNGGNK